jgi:putative SOS response-associated peptidase YedK
MCGRYYVDEETNQELLKIIRNLDKRLAGVPTQPGKKERRVKTGEIFPSDTVPIICQGKESACYDAMTWGYPTPSKGNQSSNLDARNKGSLIINARGESAHEKPMFSRSLSSGRIVVPASGFYEWTHDSNKDKYYFTAPDSPMLYMAGLSRTFETDQNFVILTTKANECMEDIHDRMPVLLYKDEISDYLSSKERADYYIHRKPALLKREIVKKEESKKEDSASSMYNQLQLPLD